MSWAGGDVVRRCRCDRGASPVTFVILVPVLVMFAELTVMGGRLTLAQGKLNTAAREAARVASVAAGPESAEAVVQSAVDAAFNVGDPGCTDPVAELGPNHDFVPGGNVEVLVVCEVSLAGLGLISGVGSITLDARAMEPVDRYRVVRG